MAIRPITPAKSKDIFSKLSKCKKPQRYLGESKIITSNKINILKNDDVEYFSPFASTGVKLNRNV